MHFTGNIRNTLLSEGSLVLCPRKNSQFTCSPCHPLRFIFFVLALPFFWLLRLRQLGRVGGEGVSRTNRIEKQRQVECQEAGGSRSCLLACLAACLLACWLAGLLACLLSAGWFAALLAGSLAGRLACLFALFAFAGLRACLPACLFCLLACVVA